MTEPIPLCESSVRGLRCHHGAGHGDDVPHENGGVRWSTGAATVRRGVDAVSVPRSVVVHGCGNINCGSHDPDERRALQLREVLPGVVDVPNLACSACGCYLYVNRG